MTADLDPGVVQRLADMHAVYRMYDHAGRLLYIGVSGRAGRRFDQHAEKRWFPLVSTITLEWYAAYGEAAVAEKRAIAAECPRYNITGSPVAPKRAARGKDAPPPVPAAANTLSDILKIFGDSPGLHWRVIAERLAGQLPRWDGAVADVVSAQCRTLGVPSVVVTAGGKRGRGCRRVDVEKAATEQILTA